MRTSVLPEGVELEGNVAGSGDLVVRGTEVLLERRYSRLMSYGVPA